MPWISLLYRNNSANLCDLDGTRPSLYSELSPILRNITLSSLIFISFEQNCWRFQKHSAGLRIVDEFPGFVEYFKLQLIISHCLEIVVQYPFCN